MMSCSTGSYIVINFIKRFQVRLHFSEYKMYLPTFLQTWEASCTARKL